MWQQDQGLHNDRELPMYTTLRRVLLTNWGSDDTSLHNNPRFEAWFRSFLTIHSQSLKWRQTKLHNTAALKVLVATDAAACVMSKELVENLHGNFSSNQDAQRTIQAAGPSKSRISGSLYASCCYLDRHSWQALPEHHHPSKIPKGKPGWEKLIRFAVLR